MGGLEALGLLAFLVGPGLVALHIGRELRPDASEKPSADSDVLEAFSLALSVAAVLLAVAAFASWVDDSIPIWGGLRLREIAHGQALEVVKARTAEIAVVASLQYLFFLLALGVLGWIGLFELITRGRAQKQWLTRNDPWQDAIAGSRRSLNASKVHAHVYLASGEEYIGLIQSVSAIPNSDGSRDIFLGSPARILNGQLAVIGPPEIPAGMILSTRDIRIVELAYAP